MTKTYPMFTERGYNKQPQIELEKKGYKPFNWNWYSGIGYHHPGTGKYALLREFGGNETIKIYYDVHPAS